MDSRDTPVKTSFDTSRPGPTHIAPQPAWLRFFVPSVADLIFIVLLAAMTGGTLAPRLLGDASIGWHIRNGDLMLQSHSVTRTDSFSVTMNGQPWYSWEWLYDLKIASIHHWWGLNGVVFFTAVIIAATFAVTLTLCLRRGADLPVTVTLLALSLGESMIHLFARPHVLSWLLTVIWFQLLDSSESADDPRAGRRLWWLPVLMLLWVNVHGGFVMGFVLLAIYLASNAVGYFQHRQEDISRAIAARLRGLGTITAACLLASLVNPYGYRLHAHIYRYLSSRWLMNHIDEFLSPNFHGVAQQCFVLILLITIVGLALDRLQLARLLVAIFAVYSGLYASRSLPVSSLLLTMVIAPLFTQAVGEEQGNAKLSWRLRAFFSRWAAFGSRMRNMELNFRGHVWPAGAMMLGVMVCIHQGKLGSYQWMDAHFDAKKFPVHASEVLVRRGIREPVFAQDSWGGYVIYRLYPENKVLVDDRHDLYGEEFLRNYLKTVRVTPDWENFLNDKHVNWALVPTGSSLDNMLKQTARWNVVYRDDTAILFARKMDQ